MKHKLKRLTALFLAFAISMSLFSAAAWAEETGEVVASGTCGDNLTWTLDDEGTLTISGTGDMYDYDGEDAPWYKYRSSICIVKVQDGVTSIGEWAFNSCDSLASVTIPDSVTTIGDSAFYSCDSLASVTIPDSVTTIGDDAFRLCLGLIGITVDEENPAYSSLDGVLFNKSETELVAYPGGKSGDYIIPDSVTSIGDSAFFRCYNLTSVTIPDSVTTIGDKAFQHCSSLTSVTIGNGVTSIGDSTFFYCTSLTSVTIGNSVTSIGNSAFFYCYNLTSVTIPDSVTSIGDSAFSICLNLNSITFEGNAPTGVKNVFWSEATAYYPADNSTWTEDVMQDYGGTITWIAYGSSHVWDDGKITTEAVDYESEGVKTYTCTECGATKTEAYTFINGEVTNNVRKAILWAAENGISKGYTSGADAGTFGVGNTVTREEMVIFLRRLAKFTGKNVSASSNITFSDADEIKSSGGRTAISWAVAEGITKGYSDGSFGPQKDCTREQICIFLWRLAGQPAADTSVLSDFSDADAISNNTARKAIAWASSEGIVKGFASGENAGKFCPQDSCLREQFAIMMYRYAN